MGETRVDLLHLLEDLTYRKAIQEVNAFLVRWGEAIANGRSGQMRAARLRGARRSFAP